MIWDNTEFVFGQHVAYCCILRGPATLGQYLDLWASESKATWNYTKNDNIIPNMAKLDLHPSVSQVKKFRLNTLTLFKININITV
jgi:hypothetical protein